MKRNISEVLLREVSSIVKENNARLTKEIVFFLKNQENNMLSVIKEEDLVLLKIANAKLSDHVNKTVGAQNLLVKEILKSSIKKIYPPRIANENLGERDDRNK